MSSIMENIASLHRISREELSSLLLSSDVAKLAVVDVRDDDHVGGHIHNSMHVPSSTLDYRGPEIVRKLADKEIVIFHCALSQQRGPGAALRYLRERDSKTKSQSNSSRTQQKSSALDGEQAASGSSNEPKKENQGQEVNVMGHQGASLVEETKKQKVYVLDGGFVKWQEKYVTLFVADSILLLRIWSGEC